MSDAQWMIVLHISILVLQAIIGILQYILGQSIKEIRDSMRDQFK